MSLVDLRDDLQLAEVQLATLDPSAYTYSRDRLDIEDRIRWLQNGIRNVTRQGGAPGASGGGLTNGASSSSNAGYRGGYGSDISRPMTSNSSASNNSWQDDTLFRPNSMLSPTSTLPTRKRQRENIDERAGPQFKSYRPSPNISSGSSPTASADDVGDETLRRLLGDDYVEQLRDHRETARELERRREQERRDEEYARALQAEEQQMLSAYRPPPVPRTSSQALLDRSTGGIKAMPPLNSESPEPVIAPAPAPAASSSRPPTWSFNSIPGAFPGHGNASNNILEIGSDDEDEFGDDDDLQVISSSQFLPNTSRNPAPIRRAYPWLGTGGTSVYSNPALEYLNQQIDTYGPSVQGFAGASRNLYDPTNPSWISAYDNLRNEGNTEEELKNLLENIRPDEEISSDRREDDPPELKCPLMPHQRLGLAWMKQMEEGSNKGGILADDMGLGKTIQALALIVSRPGENGRKTNLIVAPVALIQQWKREIEQKIVGRHRLTVFILHGTGRNASWDVLKLYDVVLTTYGTVASEIKRRAKWEQKLKINPNIKPTSREDALPLLSDQSKFWRIILDESQQIKNKAAKAAIGACQIQSLHRWCMSGTPMMNNVLELYSLIHFLRIKPYNSQESFNRDFTRPLSKGKEIWVKERAMEKLQALLKAILLRRTKKSKIDGKPLLQLPEKIVEQIHAVFSDDERAFYDALENKSQLTFNRYLKAGSVGRNYSNILVLLLRLRQACCHPHLIRDFAMDTGSSEVNLKVNAEAFAPDVVARLKDIEAFDCPICIDACENPQIFFPCGHAACLDCFSRMTDPSNGLAQGNEGHFEVKCPNCRTVLDPQKVTDLNTFRTVHFPDPEEAKEEEQAEGASDAKQDVKEEDVTESGGSTDSSDSETATDDDSDDDVEDDDSLHDFIVNDDDVEKLNENDDSDDSDDDLSNKRPSKADLVDRQTKDEDRKLANPEETKVKGKEKAEHVSTKKRRSKKAKDKKFKEKSKKAKGKGKGKAQERDKLEKTQLSLAHLRREGLKNKKAKKEYLQRLEENWITSAKVDKTVEILRTLAEEKKGHKTLVFSAFTSLLDLLEVPIAKAGWRYRRYDGSMSAADRNSAVLDFTDKESCTIMLVSLKAGNAGLNLVAANNVIIFDPFWNPYIEEQAIDRAYRIGQKREVNVHRIIVPETVEDRILALQEKKRELIENALDENAGRSVARLGERELAYLFGVRRDA